MKKIVVLALGVFLLVGCTQQNAMQNKKQVTPLTGADIESVITQLCDKYEAIDKQLMERGVKHAASLWRAEDGNADEFTAFCLQHYIADGGKKKEVFEKLSTYFEKIYGHLNKMSVELQRNVHLQVGPLDPVDHMFAAYSLGSHISADFYANKIAFVIALNFPYYSTEEKMEAGAGWTREEWAHARLGDLFSSRVPADVLQAVTKAEADADAYIAEYNIFMGHLLNENGEKLFPEDMVLLSHWNLRDELKSNYANKDNGLEKQKMIYQVMQRIIDQTIPKEVINAHDYQWDPVANQLFEEGTTMAGTPENEARYQHIINSFRAMQKVDQYEPVQNTYLQRKFSGDMQIPYPEVEKLFDELLSAPEVKEVAGLIKTRLGRDLQPFDIWYDGFKARSSISETKLDAITSGRYPTAGALDKAIPGLLKKLGFSNEKAAFLSDHIAVEAARGSGHAWGASMRGEEALLRTRVPETGMNYKGYNIAVHELGHNVEQTISLHDVDHYMLQGVPNTAFTEALAFIFQARDLELLDMKDNNSDKEALHTLDIFWSVYEMMGVSMLDIKVWKWMYANPDCNAQQLKEAVITIAKEVWNTYYAPVFGVKDQPVLAIYSHMVASPLYLSAYAFGDLIHFQLAGHLKGKPFAPEIERIFALGTLTPGQWMMEAVGAPISNQPLLEATHEAVMKLK